MLIEFHQNIENIIFDFGGVLLDLKPEDTWIQLSQLLGLEENEAELLYASHQQIFDEFEIGKIRFENFLWNIQRMGKVVPEPRTTINAWNAMLKGWQKEKLTLLEKLSKDFNLYLLSNTNEVHLKWVHNDLKKNHNITDFENRFFKGVVFSHEVGMRKPNQDIFKYIINKYSLNPNSSLYIDDLEQNINTSIELGFHGILHPRNAPLHYLTELK